MKNFLGVAVIGVAVLAAGPAEAGQTDSIDSRWLPWLGCWQLWEEQVEGSEQNPFDNEATAVIDRTSVCVTPTETGITLRATAGDRLLVERQLIADGQPHDVADEGCEGWERSECEALVVSGW